MQRTKRTIEEFRVNGEELAELLKLTPSRISQLTTAGVFSRGEDGLFDLTTAISEYERSLFRPSGRGYGPMGVD